MGIRVREKTKGSGVFWVFATWRGQRRAKRIGDLSAAQAVASQLRARLALGDASVLDSRPPGPSTAITFKAVAEKWLDWYPALNALRQGTLETHKSFIRTHLLPAFGALPIGEITRRRVQEFIAALRMTGSSLATGKALADLTLRTRLPTLKLRSKQTFVSHPHLPQSRWKTPSDSGAGIWAFPPISSSRLTIKSSRSY